MASREARRGGLHAGQHMRVGHQPLDAGIEIGRNLIGLDAAACQARAPAIPARRARCAIVSARACPRSSRRSRHARPGRGFLHAEEKPLGSVRRRCRQCRHRHTTRSIGADEERSSCWSAEMKFCRTADVRRTPGAPFRSPSASPPSRSRSPPCRTCTPLSMAPLVTPVAANRQSPFTMSSISYFFFGILDAHFQRALAQRFGVDDQPRLHLAADAAQRRRRQHAFRRAADAEIDVDAGLRIGAHESRRRRRRR